MVATAIRSDCWAFFLFNFIFTSSLTPLSLSLQSALETVLWSDPQEREGYGASPRGAGFLYGPDKTYGLLESCGVRRLVRGHQVVDGVDVS